MLSNDGHFDIRYDAPFLGVAVILCLLSTLALVNLNDQVGASRGRARAAWLAIAGLTGGAGIWATHFFAMLGLNTGLRSGYDVVPMVAALIIAVGGTVAGLAIAARAQGRGGAMAGGATIGAGAVAMHGCAMAGYEVAGVLDPSLALLALATVLALVLAAAAVVVGRRGGLRGRLACAMLLALAICSHHLIALKAIAILPAPGTGVAPGALAPDQLIGPVAVASVLILLLAVVALGADLRLRRRAAAEVLRMTSLADAAVEGLMICDGDRVVTANTSFALLSGHSSAAVVGMALCELLPDADHRDAWPRRGGAPVETVLLARDGGRVPVEVLVNDIEFAGKRHQAIALRDLGARKRAEDSMRFMAHHDGLTGLPNRALFDAVLDDAVTGAGRRGHGFAVLCLDLDRFKEINDLFGHGAGDEALKTVGRVLAGFAGGGRVAARLGGDEFAVLVPDAGEPAVAGRLALDILAALAELNVGRDSGPALATSIGVALFPGDGEDRQHLLNAADTALYRAKAEGRGTHRFYESGMGAEVRGRRLMEHELRTAVARGEMSLVYQPQLAVATGTIVGFEALLRWNRPAHGFVSPALFIPVAEETGTILQIGDWVLRTACAEAAGWRVPLRVAVNVSAVQLHAPGFADSVEAVLAETGIDPRRLELEVTETALIRDITRALAALTRLKQLGVKIAMDDFGTGYSSLSNLRAFPFDRIKIDGSFVQSVDANQQASAIVRAILELGRGLDLAILAEGVETKAELGFLGAELCDEVQGYLLGRPAPIETFAAATRGEAADLGTLAA